MFQIIDANGDMDSVLKQCRENMDIIVGKKKFQSV